VPTFEHKPVMVAEVLAALGPKPGGRYVDGTVGGGGHAAAILQASTPGGWLFGCDRDGAALEAAGMRLAELGGRFELKRGNFSELADWFEPESFDGVLLDLGVSSPQLDRAERGFSFQQNGPLDMRMDTRQPLTAAQLVNEASVDDLIRIFRDLGEEPEARRLARAIEDERRLRRFEATRQLAVFIEKISRRRGKRLHPATRVFQALRMAVNDELGSLRAGLMAALTILKPRARLAAITFHSGEVRLVKEFGREFSRDYALPGEVDVPELRRPVAAKLKWVQRKAVWPGADELAANPRARSAQLRVFEKI
jgi:16S rRNA (cytosine1402-N4)-methyltransferase